MARSHPGVAVGNGEGVSTVCHSAAALDEPADAETEPAVALDASRSHQAHGSTSAVASYLSEDSVGEEGLLLLLCVFSGSGSRRAKPA
ncbi:hypothetical protein ON010_g17650 [Phytophthora cinnamomi]|nr:hypothetical protein ON010_g17650 [Phytophthora cinnamomi]